MEGKGVYKGLVSSKSQTFSSVSNNKNTPLVASIVKIHAHEAYRYSSELQKISDIGKNNPDVELLALRSGNYYDFYLLPNRIQIKEGIRKTMIYNQELLKGSETWDTMRMDVGLRVSSEDKDTWSHTFRHLSRVWESFKMLGTPTASIKISFCERGIAAGGSVLAFGVGKRSLEKPNMTELANMEYISTSIEAMSQFVKSKISKQVAIILGSSVVFVVSARYFYLNHHRNDFKFAL